VFFFLFYAKLGYFFFDGVGFYHGLIPFKTTMIP